MAQTDFERALEMTVTMPEHWQASRRIAAACEEIRRELDREWCVLTDIPAEWGRERSALETLELLSLEQRLSRLERDRLAYLETLCNKPAPTPLTEAALNSRFADLEAALTDAHDDETRSREILGEMAENRAKLLELTGGDGLANYMDNAADYRREAKFNQAL